MKNAFTQSNIEMKASLLFPVYLALLWLASMPRGEGDPDYFMRLAVEKSADMKSIMFEYFPDMKDTLYALGDQYVEVSVETQTATLYQRNGENIEYKVSTGTRRVRRGVETRTGIFTVQNKYYEIISRQFYNSSLYNWIGFDGNIGFHGLKSKGYYRHLGKRACSHGCVRISLEDGRDLFERIKTGTPVMVFDREPAFVFAFADKDDFNQKRDYIFSNNIEKDQKAVRENLQRLYGGRFFKHPRKKLFFDGETILKQGVYETGDSRLVAGRQIRPLNIARDFQTTRRDCFLRETRDFDTRAEIAALNFKIKNEENIEEKIVEKTKSGKAKMDLSVKTVMTIL